MNGRIYLAIAAVMGFSAVALGAFGAHGLKKMLSAELLAVYKTAVQYQFYHGLALLMLAVLLIAASLSEASQKWLRRSALLMVIGTLLFSGSLYAYVFSGIKVLAMITPIGGVTWLVAWAFLLVAALKIKE